MVSGRNFVKGVLCTLNFDKKTGSCSYEKGCNWQGDLPLPQITLSSTSSRIFGEKYIRFCNFLSFLVAFNAFEKFRNVGEVAYQNMILQHVLFSQFLLLQKKAIVKYELIQPKNVFQRISSGKGSHKTQLGNWTAMKFCMVEEFLMNSSAWFRNFSWKRRPIQNITEILENRQNWH